jgi:hypothetical protein
VSTKRHGEKCYWIFPATGLEGRDYSEFWASGLDIGLALIFEEVHTRVGKARLVMMIHDVVYPVYQGVLRLRYKSLRFKHVTK